MPTVKPLRGPTVDGARPTQLQPMQAPTVRSGANAQSFGSDFNIGNGLMAAAEGAADMVLDNMKRENEAKAKDAEEQLIEFERSLLHDPKTGYYTKNGRDAVEAREQTAKALKERADEIAETLTSPYAKEQFTNSVTPRIGARAVDIDKYASRQQVAWEDSQSAARIDGAARDAIDSAVGPDGRPDVAQIELNSSLALQEAHEVADRKGMSPEERQQSLELVQSGIHKGVIDRLLAQPGGAIEAKAYYSANKDEVVGAAKTQVESALKDGVAAAEAIVQSEAIVNRAVAAATAVAESNSIAGSGEVPETPKVRVSGWFGDAMAEADQIADPVVREKVRSKVIERAKQMQAIEDQREAAAWDAAVDAVDRGQNPDDLPFAIKDEIGVTKLNALRGQYETAGKRITTRSGREFIDDLYTGDASDIAARDPREMRQELSDADYNVAVSLINSAKDAVGGKTSDFDPRNAQARGYLKTLLEAADLGGSNQKDRRGQIELQVVNALSAAAKAKGSGLSFDEQKQIIDRLMTTVGEPTTIAGFEVSEGDKLFEIDDVGSIPEDDRENITAVFQQNYQRDPTDQEMIDVYVQFKLQNQ